VEQQDGTERGGVMVTTMRAAEVSWCDLSTRFGLQLTEDATFFLEGCGSFATTQS